MAVVAAVLVPGGLLLARLRGQLVTTTDTASWLGMIYLGVVTMVVAYALLFTGSGETPGATAVVATLLEPVTAVLVAVGFLRERLTPAAVLGCLLILAAMAVLGRRSMRPQPP
jgi:DME family drug/metabolite transporter